MNFIETSAKEKVIAASSITPAGEGDAQRGQSHAAHLDRRQGLAEQAVGHHRRDRRHQEQQGRRRPPPPRAGSARGAAGCPPTELTRTDQASPSQSGVERIETAGAEQERHRHGEEAAPDELDGGVAEEVRSAAPSLLPERAARHRHHRDEAGGEGRDRDAGGIRGADLRRQDEERTGKAGARCRASGAGSRARRGPGPPASRSAAAAGCRPGRRCRPAGRAGPTRTRR